LSTTGFSTEQIRSGTELYEAGHSVPQAAAVLGVHVNTLYDALKRSGAQMRSVHHRHED
jgi:transposase